MITIVATVTTMWYNWLIALEKLPKAIDSYLVTVAEERDGTCPNGTNLIRRIANDQNYTSTVSIGTSSSATPENRTNASNGKGTNTTVIYNPNQNGIDDIELVDPRTGNVAPGGAGATPGFIVLAHELIHADRNARGVRLTGDQDYTYQVGSRIIDGGRDREITTKTDKYTSSNELATVGLANVKYGDITENMIRAEHPLRQSGRYFI